MDFSRGTLSRVLALALVSNSALFASVIWGSATNISGDSDVATTGTLVDAWNMGAAGVTSTTVNGVLFTGVNVEGPSPVSDSTFHLSLSTLSDPFPSFGAENTAGSGNAPFSGLSSSYQALLSSLMATASGPVTLEISGLTPGRSYLFQGWSNRSSSTGASGVTFLAGNAVALDGNTTDTLGGLGQ